MGNVVNDIIPHLRTGKIKQELVPSHRGLPSRLLQRPFGVGTVQVAIGVNGFRLEPQPKAQPHGGDLLRQTLDATGEFFAVDGIIAKTRCIAVSLTKPAVIKDKQFDADRFGLFGEGKQFRFGKIKEVRLPVIKQDRTRFFLPISTQDMLPYKAMKIAAKAI